MLPKLICLLVLAASSLVCVRATVKNGDELRLPEYVTPIHYDLFIKVFFQVLSTDAPRTDRFIGQADIDIVVGEQTNRILFHADYSLKLSLIEIVSLDGKLISLDPTQYQQIGNQLYAITLEEKIEVGQYKLKISYEGDFGGAANIIGFYKTKYEEDGITKAIVATKFQPTDARKAFPCFDEPALKATFSITIEHPENSMALSNWPVLGQTKSQFRVTTKFEKTDPMSTYLAAWTVLPEDFAFKEAFTANGKPIRVYARKKAVQNGLVDFAVLVAKETVDYFENNYFDGLDEAVPPKIDMLAFPDFPSGAMEHWGLIGYRESSLLISTDSDDGSSASALQSVAFIIAHELSHFWFGNLVTCKWWNDLWLNEAMARFLQFKAINNIYPEWLVDEQFLTLYEIPVMFDDAVPSSSPVAAQVNTPAEINSAFSSITYDKGSSLLRMLEDTVGEENFRTGLNEFIRANKFQAAEAAAFYNSLELPDIIKKFGVTPQQYMENWLNEPNYPEVITVLEKSPLNPKNTEIILGQRRVLLQQNNNSSEVNRYFWKIYMKCKAGKADGTITQLEVYFENSLTILSLEGEYIWIKCNNDFKGFYSTLYEPQNYQAIANLLRNENNQVFSSADRANILNDAFLSAFIGSRGYGSVMLASSYLLKYEFSYVPWRTFTWHVTKLASILEHRSSFGDLIKLGQRFIDVYLVNWNPLIVDHQDQLKASTFTEFAGRIQNKTGLQTAGDLFTRLINEEYFTNPDSKDNKVNPNVRGAVYKYAVQTDLGYTIWEQLFSLYTISVDPQERAYALNALAYTRNSWQLEKLFEELLADNSKIRAQDFFTLLNAISRNPVGRPLAWQFLRSQWDAIVKKFQLSNRTLASTTKTICETFSTEVLYEEMENFFYFTDPGAGVLQRQQARDTVIHNIYWVQNKEQELIENIQVFLWINQ